MPLKVLNVAYPFARVSPETPGGAEQVLAMLDEALVSAGHSSFVLAPEGSTCKGHFISFRSDVENLNEESRMRARCRYQEKVREAIADVSPDVVHFHGVDFDSYLPECEASAAVTLHLPLGWYSQSALADSQAGICRICVSQSQKKLSPGPALIQTVIENGIKLSEFRLTKKKQEYVVALGRICPEKGFHIAMDAAAKVGMKLVLAGAVFDYPTHQAYFEECIRPRLAAGHEFVGALGVREKADLLAGARCLLVPSLVPETSSLVTMESMACGTPVVALRTGALCELIEDGRTGFLVNDEIEMSRCVERAVEIDPVECRREAEARFSSETMSDQYLRLYARMAPRKRRNISTRAAEQYSLRVLTNIEQAGMLRTEWLELYRRCVYCTPFQHPDWLLAWIQCFRPSNPLMLEIRRNTDLVGLAPLLIYSRGRERVLGLMGGGVSDYLDVLVDPRYRPHILRVLADYFSSESPEWDVVDFTDLSGQSPLLCLVSVNGKTCKHDVCPAIDVASAVKDLRKIAPSRQLRNLRNATARLERAGENCFEVASEDNLETMLDALYRLHEQRWQGSGTAGVLSNPAVQKFHNMVGPALLRAGILRLHGLRLSNRFIALLYTLVDRGCTHCYLQGFDPEFSALSPGTLILGHVLQHAIDNGSRRVDFLRGQEAYKYSWGAHDTITFRREFRHLGRSDDAERKIA